MSNLTQLAISSANITYHIRKVKEASHLRQHWENAVKLKQSIENGADVETIRKLLKATSDALFFRDSNLPL